jgi:hypothetical protein
VRVIPAPDFYSRARAAERLNCVPG